MIKALLKQDLILAVSGGGGGGGGRRSTIPTVRSIVTKLGKMQVGKTATMETYNFGKVQFWK